MEQTVAEAENGTMVRPPREPDVRDRGAPLKSYRTILKQQIVTGLVEHRRPTLGLFLSSLSAGLDLGFSLLLMAVVSTLFADASTPWQPLLVANMYALGFILVILGRSELFTEHTALAILPVLDRRSNLVELARVWTVVYSGNVIGAASLGWLIGWFAPEFGIADPAALIGIAQKAVDHPWWAIFISGVLAGWLMGELAWLIGAARDTISQIICVWLVTAAIGLAGLHHAIVGAAEVVAGIVVGSAIDWDDFGLFQLWATLGNAVGGVVFVAIIKYGHAHQGSPVSEDAELEK